MAGEQDPNVRYIDGEAAQAAVGHAFHRRPDDVPIGASVPKSGSSIFFGGCDVYATGPDSAFFEKLPVERRVTDVRKLAPEDLSEERAREVFDAVKAVIELEDRAGDVAEVAKIPNPFRPRETEETLAHLVYVALTKLPEASVLPLTWAIGAAVVLVMAHRGWVGNESRVDISR